MPSSPSEPAVRTEPLEQSGSGAPAHAGKGSYSQILKSTALIGGTSVLNIAVGVIRSKAIALILGPSGVGLNGLYMSITGLAENIAGMGINSSGVRQIAEAVGTQDNAKIAKTAAILRWTSLALGVTGALALIAFSSQISKLTFGDARQTGAVCILALSVFFHQVSNGQGALLQGLRRISDLARAGILGTVGATVVTLPLVYFLREQGIALSIAAGAGVGLLVSWWFSRQVAVERPAVTAGEIREEAKELLHLGSALMVSGLVSLGCSYAIRTAIFRQLGQDATGLYQAAWTMGSVYVGFILQSMGSDFYPRLTAAARNHGEANRLVNEQAHVSLLLAGTGVIGTLTFAPLVLNIFYAASFSPAITVLRWLCLGTALQVVSWPMGFIIVAKGDKAALVWSELAWAAVHLGLAWFGLQWFGLQGAGIAFFGSYVFHIGVTYFMARRLTQFRWSVANRNATVGYLGLIGSVFCAVQFLPNVWGMLLGGVVMVACGVYSMRTLASLVSLDRIPAPMRRMLRLLGGSVAVA
jgi:PST family polysaccharide transporter